VLILACFLGLGVFLSTVESRDEANFRRQVRKALEHQDEAALIRLLTLKNFAKFADAVVLSEGKGWRPKTALDNAALFTARRMWSECVQIGKPALPILAAIAAHNHNSDDTRIAAIESISKIEGIHAVGILAEVARSTSNDAVTVKIADVLYEVGGATALKEFLALCGNNGCTYSSKIRASRLSGDQESVVKMVRALVIAKNGPALRAVWPETNEVLLADLLSGVPTNIARAVNGFVGIGKKEILQQLEEIIFQHGTVKMAEAYLNCGNTHLKNAAQKWAKDHGYVIIPREGSPSVTWGSW
jgi:hypothetical protein